MPVLTREQILEELENVPEVEYPEAVMQRLDGEYEVALAQLATGELKPQTVAEFAAEYGIIRG